MPMGPLLLLVVPATPVPALSKCMIVALLPRELTKAANVAGMVFRYGRFLATVQVLSTWKCVASAGLDDRVVQAGHRGVQRREVGVQAVARRADPRQGARLASADGQHLEDPGPRLPVHGPLVDLQGAPVV